MTRAPEQPAPTTPSAVASSVAGEEPGHDLRTLFGQSTAVSASSPAGPAHMLESANPAFFAAIGDGDRTGVPLAQLMPVLAEQGFLKLLVTPSPSG
ncbi:hypothetical protein [Streptomyces sp. NPDC005046]